MVDELARGGATDEPVREGYFRPSSNEAGAGPWTDLHCGSRLDRDSDAPIYPTNIGSGLVDAQDDYNTNSALRGLLARASAAPTVRRLRERRE